MGSLYKIIFRLEPRGFHIFMKTHIYLENVKIYYFIFLKNIYHSLYSSNQSSLALKQVQTAQTNLAEAETQRNLAETALVTVNNYETYTLDVIDQVSDGNNTLCTFTVSRATLHILETHSKHLITMGFIVVYWEVTKMLLSTYLPSFT